MKICFVGPANSAHMIKWCNWFNEHGHEVHVISFTPGKIRKTKVHLVKINVDAEGSDLEKLKYLLTGKQIKRLIDRINPDVVNAHYATSYGIAIALSGVEKYTLSVWGSDIYDFPKKSILHRAMLQCSLHRAAHLFSTSRTMAEEASLYTRKKFDLTPFGVDMDLFHPNKRTRTDNHQFVVGTVKSLSDVYGIPLILRAVAEIAKEGEIPITLRIAGRGPQEQEYKQLAKELGIEDKTSWLGFIDQRRAAEEWANMDVAIIPSYQESFGVAAVEAQACETAVIVSDISGLMETTEPDVSSIVVKRGDDRGIADAIRQLYYNPVLLQQMSQNGREYVKEHYELNCCFEHIESLLKKYRRDRT